MKRMHVHIAVQDIPNAVKFYSAQFATQSIVAKPDYAKRILDDPRVNFAISTRGEVARVKACCTPQANQAPSRQVASACCMVEEPAP